LIEQIPQRDFSVFIPKEGEEYFFLYAGTLLPMRVGSQLYNNNNVNCRIHGKENNIFKTIAAADAAAIYINEFIKGVPKE
jgi:hypothetical protein